ncbi:MAG: tRNA (adenosine(37)-N6)-dimethylallyltransferase MiaA, partial [bacterium]|nr:tRNA (adenosine(37)-N6)-dimethylallyltransferase MiaA [bacterium]
ADSRQVYKGLNLGAGKITKKEMRGVPHHLLSVASPRRTFSVQQYQKEARKAIESIFKKGKTPFLVGGSPLYIYVVTDGWLMPEVKPDPKLRKRLEKLSAAQLFSRLRKLDPRRAKTIEQKNKRRLVRALEIVLKTGKPVPKLRKRPLPYPVLFLGIKREPDALAARIRKRLVERLRRGMVREVQNLKKSGVPLKRLEAFGLEYRFISRYLQDRISKSEMEERIVRSSLDFARRQMAWFKKDPRIRWIRGFKEAESLVKGV